jgi:hypothetical protein
MSDNVVQLFDARTRAAHAWLDLAAWLESPDFREGLGQPRYPAPERETTMRSNR